MKKTFYAGIILGILLASAVRADVPQYTVMRTTGKIIIDGILDDPDWAAARTVGAFVFPWWTSGEKEQTEAKMLWDDNFLYIAYRCDDTHIWADHYDTNTATCLDDCVEIFWNPNPKAGDGYNMFEMNCIGNVLAVCNDLKKPAIGNKILPPHIAQRIEGTVNNDADTDKGWVLEAAIRFSDYPGLFDGGTPKDGDMWRVGLHRCGGKTNEQFSQWSASQTPQPNFHSPKDFGKLLFVMKPVK